jgi:hypothetical protein
VLSFIQSERSASVDLQSAMGSGGASPVHSEMWSRYSELYDRNFFLDDLKSHWDDGRLHEGEK